MDFEPIKLLTFVDGVLHVYGDDGCSLVRPDENGEFPYDLDEVYGVFLEVKRQDGPFEDDFVSEYSAKFNTLDEAKRAWTRLPEHLDRLKACVNLKLRFRTNPDVVVWTRDLPASDLLD